MEIKIYDSVNGGCEYDRDAWQHFLLARAAAAYEGSAIEIEDTDGDSRGEIDGEPDDDLTSAVCQDWWEEFCTAGESAAAWDVYDDNGRWGHKIVADDPSDAVDKAAACVRSEDYFCQGESIPEAWDLKITVRRGGETYSKTVTIESRSGGYRGRCRLRVGDIDRTR